MTDQQQTTTAPTTIDDAEWRTGLPAEAGLFEWRLPHADGSGRFVTFTARMRTRGAGHVQVISPEFDHWDGWRVILPRGLLWRPAPAGAKPTTGRDVRCTGVEGLEPEPCPFCHATPRFEGHVALTFGGHDFGAAPHHWNRWSLKCCAWATTPHHPSPEALVERRRAMLAGNAGASPPA